MKKQAIGFTGKFYAVWNIEIMETEVCPGCTKKTTVHRYGRKASKYLNVALAKYPDLVLDDTLNEKDHTFWTNEYIWTTLDVFRFGKHHGEKIEDCQETDYIAWYWAQVYDDHKAYVENILNSRNWKAKITTQEDEDSAFVLKVKQMTSGDEEALEKNDISMMSPELKKFYTVNEFTFTPKANISCNGNYMEGNIIYHFMDYKTIPGTYYAPSYTLPTINGTAKRIKNKNVTVNKFKLEVNKNKIIVNILNFKITK